MPPLPFFLTLLQLAVLTCVTAGAYYGHKQHPQQYQPVQHHQQMGKEGFPQQQYLGKEVPYMQYPHYRKEIPQMPMHKGKGNAHKGDGYNGGQDKVALRGFPKESLAQPGHLELRDLQDLLDLQGMDSPDPRDDQDH
ncbi:hypothetical protein NQZ68_004071 [Dissostichus eleginoides]|nr:hypothetical protein NQZ68_004071 [Dissostichus eleginoides]